MKKIMKKALSFIVASVWVLTASAQYSTSFHVTEITDNELRENIDLVVNIIVTYSKFE